MHVAVVSSLAPAEIAGDVQQVRTFIDAQEAALGFRPMSDQGWADLVHGAASPTVTAHIAGDVSGTPGCSPGADLVAYAQASATPSDDRPGAWTVELVLDVGSGAQTVHLGRQAIAAIIPRVIAAGGDHLVWVVQDPTPMHGEIAATFGLRVDRQLHQMRRALPTGLPFDIVTRPFEPARDLDDWVLVNARAFRWNPEQGNWTRANVIARMDEPWFDADGFLVHDRTDDDGRVRMAGFCWTKVHATATPPLGEIYVIAVDPDFHGHGLGRALTLAGLDSLAHRGITMAMLFVDADNAAAVRLYATLGFTVHRTDCLYIGRLAERPIPKSTTAPDDAGDDR